MPFGIAYDVLPTPALTREQRRTLRALLDLAFAGRFADSDWAHTLGGLHVLAREGDVLVGHGAVVPRQLTAGARHFRTGYVEALAVHPDWRRRGIGDQTMIRIEEAIRGAYDLGALAATDDSLRLYQRRGWVEWRGPLAGRTPAGVVATPEEVVHVLIGEVPVDLQAALTCDWREGDLW